LITLHSIWFLWTAVFAIPDEIHQLPLAERPLWDQLMLVWCSGWITAASTGLGALPFLFMGKPGDQAVAVCNATAAGMMVAASIGLVAEGCLEESTPDTILIPPIRVLMGVYMGIAFVKATSAYFDGAEPIEMLDTSVINTKRVLLIMTVMTLHSISEGIGIGVSFHSESLGGFVSATLAIHNVPEGVAIAIVLFPRGFSLLSVTLWCIFSSLPQPAMAVPAYLFTQQFVWVFPMGLGVAAGAMGLVVMEELLPEALEHLSQTKTYAISISAMFIMGMLQLTIRQNSIPS
jgi:zinc transporter ZupT